jgi:drug/metabolite transporter (DMT)-like permease
VACVLSVRVVLAGRVALPRLAVGDVGLMAVSDTAGYGFYLLGAERSVAIAAVIGAQYALVTILISSVAFHEHLTRIQKVGVAVTLTGVATVAALQAV